jgi:hypothetical protein
MLRTLSVLHAMNVKILSKTRMVNDGSNSLDDSSIPTLQRRKGKQWVHPDESDEDSYSSPKDSHGQDIALAVDNASNKKMLDYLCLVVIVKGIKSPNIGS